MSMQGVKSTGPISRIEYHDRLRTWIRESDEHTNGEVIKDKRAPRWIFISDGEKVFSQDADATREAIEAYLAIVDQQGEDLAWIVKPSSKGYLSLVEPGTPPREIPGLYLYQYRPKPERV